MAHRAPVQLLRVSSFLVHCSKSSLPVLLQTLMPLLLFGSSAQLFLAVLHLIMPTLCLYAVDSGVLACTSSGCWFCMEDSLLSFVFRWNIFLYSRKLVIHTSITPTTTPMSMPAFVPVPRPDVVVILVGPGALVDAGCCVCDA
jgi:hypothetical protein